MDFTYFEKCLIFLKILFMVSLNILCSDPHNILKVTQKKKEKKIGKEHIRKFFVAHQKFSKIFHSPSIFA